MNKNLTISTLLFVLTCLLTLSCKKHTCECYTRNARINQIDVPTFYDVKGKRSDAKKQCEAYNKSEDAEGYFTTCEIK